VSEHPPTGAVQDLKPAKLSMGQKVESIVYRVYTRLQPEQHQRIVRIYGGGGGITIMDPDLVSNLRRKRMYEAVHFISSLSRER
jgi:hypothetical protein